MLPKNTVLYIFSYFLVVPLRGARDCHQTCLLLDTCRCGCRIIERGCTSLMRMHLGCTKPSLPVATRSSLKPVTRPHERKKCLHTCARPVLSLLWHPSAYPLTCAVHPRSSRSRRMHVSSRACFIGGVDFAEQAYTGRHGTVERAWLGRGRCLGHVLDQELVFERGCVAGRDL